MAATKELSDSCYFARRNGIYPLTAFAPLTNLTNNRPRAVSPELAESVKSDTPEPLDTEPRMVIQMTCQVTKPTEVEEYSCPQVRDAADMRFLCKINEFLIILINCFNKHTSICFFLLYHVLTIFYLYVYVYMCLFNVCMCISVTVE